MTTLAQEQSNDKSENAQTRVDDLSRRDHLFYVNEDSLRADVRAIGVERYDYEKGVESEVTVLNGTALEFGMAQSDWGDGDSTTRSRKIIGEHKVYLGISLMNREHAVVHMPGGEVRIAHCTRGPDGERELRFLKQDDFLKRYAAVRFKFEGRSQTLAMAWLSSTVRRQFEGVGFFPGSEIHPPKVPDGYLNLFRGYAIKPKPGDWSRFRAHLLNCVCGGDEALLAWLLDWFAQMFQEPQKKMGSAVVLISPEKGTGKSMVASFLQRILGQYAISVSKSDHVTGKFNSHLESAILLTAEEAFFAGDKAAASTIKDMITVDKIAIERKGMDVYAAPNYTRLLITSNELRVVPVGRSERRYLVLNVNNPQANQTAYFDPIYRQMYEEGGLAAFLDDMLEREVASNLRQPPETDALVDQREESLDGVDRAVLKIAREGLVRNASESTYELAATKTEIRTETVRQAIAAECNIYEQKSIDKRAGQLLRQLGVARERSTRTKGRGYGSDERPWVYVFPPLDTFRMKVEEVLHVKAAIDERTSVEDLETDDSGAAATSMASEPQTRNNVVNFRDLRIIHPDKIDATHIENLRRYLKRNGIEQAGATADEDEIEMETM